MLTILESLKYLVVCVVSLEFTASTLGKERRGDREESFLPLVRSSVAVGERKES